MFRSHWTIIREHVDPSQSYHCPLVFTLRFGAAEACLYEVLGYIFGVAETCLYEVLGYVCIPLSVCNLRCYAWY